MSAVLRSLAASDAFCDIKPRATCDPCQSDAFLLDASLFLSETPTKMLPNEILSDVLSFLKLFDLCTIQLSARNLSTLAGIAAAKLRYWNIWKLVLVNYDNGSLTAFHFDKSEELVEEVTLPSDCGAEVMAAVLSNFIIERLHIGWEGGRVGLLSESQTHATSILTIISDFWATSAKFR